MFNDVTQNIEGFHDFQNPDILKWYHVTDNDYYYYLTCIVTNSDYYVKLADFVKINNLPMKFSVLNC